MRFYPKTNGKLSSLTRDLLIKLWEAPLSTGVDTTKSALLQIYINISNSRSYKQSQLETDETLDLGIFCIGVVVALVVFVAVLVWHAAK